MMLSRRTCPARARLAGAGGFLVLLFGVLAPPPAGAQIVETDPFPPSLGTQGPGDDLPWATSLSLAEAERRAIDLGEEVAIVRERIAQAEEEITQIRAGALPAVSANLAYTRSIRSIFDGLAAPGPPDDEPSNGPGDGEDNPFADLPFGRPNTWIAGIRVTQPLYVAGRVGIGLDIAERVRETLRHELAETEAEVRLQVREAYFQSAFTRVLVEIAEEAYALADAQLQQVQDFRDQGVASELDVLTARVERDNLEPQVVEARNGAHLALLALLRLVQLPGDTEVELTTPLTAELSPVDAPALRAALEERAILRAARTRIRIEEDQVRLARSGYRPTVGAFLDLGWQAFPATVLPTGGGGWREDWNAGFQVSIPVFNGFRTRAEIQSARSGVRQADLELDQLIEGLILGLEGDLSQLEAALSQVEARRGTVEEALRIVELAELRFAAGSGTALELSNTRLLLQRARVNEVEAILSYVTALARLERASGGSVPLLRDRIQEYD
ncbi:MAG: TolC family protein [Gemmatimonadales bacterium]|nr:MAG: TolC family protein [Gemmatimonadales bacterium]